MLYFIVVGGVINESTFQDSGMILTWESPVFPQGTILYYEVAVNRSSSNFYQTYRTESNEFNANSNDLPPGMYCIQVCSVCVCVSMCAATYVRACVLLLFFYLLQVRAVTSVGPGEYSDCHPFEVITLAGMFFYPPSLVLYILCLLR